MASGRGAARAWSAAFSFACVLAGPGGVGAQSQPTTAKQWHAFELAFSGPTHSESNSNPNPFLDYRLHCRFTAPSARTWDVPGFFDTNGQGGQSGSLWKCRFTPSETGTWTYTVSFRSGPQVAVSLDPDAGVASHFDGAGGSFKVSSSTKTGRDFRAPAHGFILNEGAHYFQFSGSGKVWVKGGANIPENFFGYRGFDNTPNAHHAFTPHVGDWSSGDPDWGNTAGRGIIGALNYLAATGVNSLYIMPLNVGGDGNDTFPTIALGDRFHFDTSKLLQWEKVLTHADAKGIFIHLQTVDRQSQGYHDEGTLGPQRKIFYRELVARFAHHLGLAWDLGEETDYGSELHKQFAAYLRALDPYDHAITVHTRNNEEHEFYEPLLGDPGFDATSFQTSSNNLDEEVIEWRESSAAAGRRWVISVDEPTRIENDLDDEEWGYAFGRKEYLWPVYLSGGGGFEWYVQEDGGGFTYDGRIENFREMEPALFWTRHALDFLSRMRLLQSVPAPALSDADHTLAEIGRAYAVYVRNVRPISIDLSASTQQFLVRWLNPRNGAWHDGGMVSGGGWRSIGGPPFGGDAAALLVRTNDLSGSGFCLSAASCNDGKACTVNSCEVRGCVFTPMSCSDGNPCTNDSCHAGDCIHVNNTASCDDGLYCTVGDTCSGGACSGAQRNCSDGIACTINACDEAANVCTHTPNHRVCDDGDVCTDDVCDAGAGCTHEESCASGNAAIAIDPASIKTACGPTAGDTLKIPAVQVAALPSRILVVTLGAKENNLDCDVAHPSMSVRYAGRALSLAVAGLSDKSTYRACDGIFYLLDPPVGTADVTIAFPTASDTPIDERLAGAVVLYNVAQQAPEAIASSGAEASTNPVATGIPTFTNGAWAIDVITQGNPGTFAATQPGQTQQWQLSCAGSSLATSTRPMPVSGVATLGWSHSNPKRYAHALAAFAPVDTASPTTTTTTTTLPPECTGACASIQMDSSSIKTACSSSASDSITIPDVTVSALPDRVLVVTVGGEEDNADCNLAHANMSVRYGAAAMSRAVTAVSGTSSWRACNGVFYLLDPPPGTANVNVTFPALLGDAIDVRQAGAFLLYNVAQSPPEAVKSAGAANSTTPMSTSITTLSNGAWVVDVVTQGNPGTFTPTQAGQTLAWQRSCGAQSSSSAASTKETVGTGTTVLAWSHTSPKRFAHSLAAFAPAQGDSAYTALVHSTTSITTTPRSSTTSSSSTTAPN